jgi:DnaK suppressor protein
MRARELDRYKRLLLEKQQELSTPPGDTAAVVPPAGEPSGDLLDKANADLEAALQIRLHQTDGRLLRAIDEALARIRDGSFGICKACGHHISKARLEAVPWTRLCRECKEQLGT